MDKSWIIDGYNLLHSCSRSSLEKHTRETLLTQLAGFASVEGYRVIVVLDGKGPQAELDKFRTSLFQALYSQDVSADTLIERMASESLSKLTTTVVTSDRSIQNMAFGSGACVMGCREFGEMLCAFEKKMNVALFKKKFESHGFHRPFEKKF